MIEAILSVVHESRTTIHRLQTDRGEIALLKSTGPRGQTNYEAVLNGTFLFSTYNRDSEKALARLAIEPILSQNIPLHVLIGGLGIGYTLQAVLENKRVHRVTVVEREPVVVDWCRTRFSSYNGRAVEDSRVTILICDFRDFLRTSVDTFHAVCLDVDNGPDWLVWEENRTLYEEPGLKEIKKTLEPGGCLAVWSSTRTESLEKKLRSVFGSSSVHTVRALEMGREVEYYIYRAMTGRRSNTI
ncbi:MAG: spermidine synthase [bacterium]